MKNFIETCLRLGYIARTRDSSADNKSRHHDGQDERYDGAPYSTRRCKESNERSSAATCCCAVSLKQRESDIFKQKTLWLRGRSSNKPTNHSIEHDARYHLKDTQSNEFSSSIKGVLAETLLPKCLKNSFTKAPTFSKDSDPSDHTTTFNIYMGETHFPNYHKQKRHDTKECKTQLQDELLPAFNKGVVIPGTPKKKTAKIRKVGSREKKNHQKVSELTSSRSTKRSRRSCPHRLVRTEDESSLQIIKKNIMSTSLRLPSRDTS
ncbi:hypothetical protein YC2023_072632 [Brassica napus]